MASIIGELSLDDTDAFSTSLANEVQSGQDRLDEVVRRPLRGLQVKKDTYASLSLIGPAGVPTIRNSSASPDRPVSFTSNFILQSVQKTRSEKFQGMTTFGASYGFFFGENLVQYAFSAVLPNSEDFQWEIEWWANYDEYLRGTRLTEQGVRVVMRFGDQLVEGYILSASTSESSDTPHLVPLNFTMWVTNHEFIVEPGDTSYPASDTYIRESAIETEFESSALAVRNQNIRAAGGGTGLLAALRGELSTNAVQGFIGGAGAAVRTAKNFLYGRNLVIPAGAAGSEVIAGSASFAFGTLSPEATEALAAIGLTSTTLRLPKIAQEIKDRGSFYDNVDEYPAKSGLAKAGVFQMAEANEPGTDTDAIFTTRAQEAFASFGIDITNESSEGAELSRSLGKATFIVATIGTQVTGFSQAAASLTVGSVVGGVVAANERQAATGQ